jgi:hypothetical protein
MMKNKKGPPHLLTLRLFEAGLEEQQTTRTKINTVRSISA